VVEAGVVVVVVAPVPVPVDDDPDPLAVVVVVVAPELDIVCVFPRLERASAIGERCEQAFGSLAHAGWHTAKLTAETAWLRRSHPWIEPDAEALTVLRMVLMKPAHADVLDELAAVLRQHLRGG